MNEYGHDEAMRDTRNLTDCLAYVPDGWDRSLAAMNINDLTAYITRLEAELETSRNFGDEVSIKWHERMAQVARLEAQNAKYEAVVDAARRFDDPHPQYSPWERAHDTDCEAYDELKAALTALDGGLIHE